MTDKVTSTQKLDKVIVDGFVEARKARILDKGLYDYETVANHCFGSYIQEVL